jgi:gas vesicle protein
MSKKGNGGFGWFLLGFFLGGVIGATAALAYAPEKGDETRERLREKGIELQGQAQQVAGKVKERVGVLRQQAEVQIGQVRQQVEQGVQAARQYTEGLSERLQSKPGEETAAEDEE